MRDDAYETGNFQHKGRWFEYALYYDSDYGPPWKEHDGHGPVSEHRHHGFGQGSKPPKAPGERILYWERGSYRTYDIAEATKIAKRDGWGLGKEDEAELAQRLGREPTRKQIIAEAVERDFKYLRGWCTDEWHWCWMKVTHEDTSEDATLCGLQSDDDAFLDEAKHELADQIADQLDDDMVADIIASRPDMQPDFHP